MSILKSYSAGGEFNSSLFFILKNFMSKIFDRAGAERVDNKIIIDIIQALCYGHILDLITIVKVTGGVFINKMR